MFEKRNIKKIHICIGWYLHPVQMPPCHVGGRKGHLYQAEASPSTNVRHLNWVSLPVQMLTLICAGSIPGTNEGYELVQMRVMNQYKRPFSQ
jgi:hypothetical protein